MQTDDLEQKKLVYLCAPLPLSAPPPTSRLSARPLSLMADSLCPPDTGTS